MHLVQQLPIADVRPTLLNCLHGKPCQSFVRQASLESSLDKQRKPIISCTIIACDMLLEHKARNLMVSLLHRQQDGWKPQKLSTGCWPTTCPQRGKPQYAAVRHAKQDDPLLFVKLPQPHNMCENSIHVHYYAQFENHSPCYMGPTWMKEYVAAPVETLPLSLLVSAAVWSSVAAPNWYALPPAVPWSTCCISYKVKFSPTQHLFV